MNTSTKTRACTRTKGLAAALALACLAGLFTPMATASAQPVIGVKAFLGIEVGASQLEVAEGQIDADAATNDGQGLTYAVEAGVTLPMQLSFGAFYRRYDGDVESPDDASVTWNMDANEFGILAEWRFPIGPVSLTGISTGMGGQLSLLTLDGARSVEDAVASAVEGEVLAGRFYGFVGVPVKSRVSLMGRVGWAIAEVSAADFQDGLGAGEPADAENTADYSGFFVAGGLRVSLF